MMSLVYTVKGTYGSQYSLSASDHISNFQRSITLSERQLNKTWFIMKWKEKTEKLFQEHLRILSVFNSVSCKSSIPHSTRYQEYHPVSKRYPLTIDLNLLFLPVRINDETLIEMYYERYNTKTTIWSKTKIHTFQGNRITLKNMNHFLSRELNLFTQEAKIKMIIQTTYYDIFQCFLPERSEDSYYIHHANEESQCRLLFRFSDKDVPVAVLLHSSNGKHSLIIGNEKKDLRFRNVAVFHEIFSVPFSDLTTLSKDLQRAFSKQIKIENHKIKKTNHLKKLQERLNQ